MAKNKSEKSKIKKQLDGEDFQFFLDEMRAFESGLNPDLFPEYLNGYNIPNAINYIEITEREPGNPNTVRAPKVDSAGELVRRDMSYKEYFQILGVDDIWMNAGAGVGPDTVRAMQFKSTNPWNFVGYQLGEGVMSDSGIYSIPTAQWSDGKYYPRYYVFVKDKEWADDEWEDLVEAPWDRSKQIIATRSNFWEGSFTGRNGINSLDDLKDETKHEMAMRDAVWHNIDYIFAGIEAGGMSLEQALAKSWDDNGTLVESSMSGIIASAHLAGAEATVRLLLYDDIGDGDETETGILTYMRMFGQALTIVDEPGNTTLSGTRVPERISCGVSDSADIVRTGGSGNNSIFVDCQKPGTPLDPPTSIEVEGADIDVAAQSNDIFYMTNPNLPITGDLEFSLEDQVGSTLVTVLDSSGANGDLKTILFRGINTAQIEPIVDQIIVPSRVFDMHYNETDHPSQIIPDFRDPGDFIRSTLSMTFKDMMFDRIDPAGVKVRSITGDGGSYFYNQLLGYSAEALKANMFVGFGGSLLDVKKGFGVSIQDFGNPPGGPEEITLNGWKTEEDTLVLGGYGETSDTFANSGYREVGGDVWYFPHGSDASNGSGYQFRIVFENTTWNAIRNSERPIIQGLQDTWDNIGQVPPV